MKRNEGARAAPVVTRGIPMKHRRLGLVVIAAAMASGCAVTSPSVMVLPGTGRPLDQFQGDEMACRQMAGVSPSGGRVTSQRQYDVVYLQCMYAKGHRVPVPPGSGYGIPATGPGTNVPPPPAGTPPPPPPGPTR
jgi:hypothetical protein